MDIIHTKKSQGNKVYFRKGRNVSSHSDQTFTAQLSRYLIYKM